LAFENVAPRVFEGAKQAIYSRSAYLAQRQFVERLMSAGTLRFFGYAGAILSGVTLGIQGGKLLSRNDTDAGLWYAGAAVAVTAGGSALTYVGGALLAGATPILLTPVGWFVLGIALLGGSFALQWAGEAAKDDEVEKWLDACTFGKRERYDAPRFKTLDDEISALGYAFHAPKQVDTDWSRKLGFEHYVAEAVVFLPGYRFGESSLRITANGQGVAPIERERQGSGTLVTLRYYLSKDKVERRVTFDIRYRPSEAFDKDYTLTITIKDPSDYDDPTLYGS
jgi:hypothetical protein